MILFIGRSAVINRYSEAVCQRQLLLYGISAVLVGKLHAVAVMEALPNQMSAIARCINQNVGRLFLKAALNDRLQIFILRLVLFEGKVIHVQNELIIPVLDAGNDIVEIAELVPAHLNNPKSPLIILIGNCLDARRFAGSRLAVKQTVIGRLSLYKGLRVLNQLLLRNLISDQILHVNMKNVLHRHNSCLSCKFSGFIMLNPKGLVQPEHPDAVFFVKCRKEILHLLCTFRRFKLLRQRADPVADSGVVGLALISGRLIVKYYR